MPREGRLAGARNLALRELYKLPRTDYVIMIDLDILGWDMKGVWLVNLYDYASYVSYVLYTFL